MSEKYNHTLNGQLSNATGSEFENSAMRYVISNANKKTILAKHVLLDFATFDDNGLVIFEAKSYADDFPLAKAKAIKSLSKITNNHNDFSLKVINPNNLIDATCIFHHPSMKDQQFVNNELKITKKRVSRFSRLLNDYFMQETYLNSLRKAYCPNVDFLKRDADLMNAGQTSDINKYFLNIYNAYNKYSNASAELKNWAKRRMQAGNLTKEDWIKESLKKQFELIYERFGEQNDY